MGFLDKIISEEEIAEILNQGAKDKNLATAHKYVETLIRVRGLEEGLSNNIHIQFGHINEVDARSWEDIVSKIEEKGQREQIEELLSTVKDEDDITG